MLILLSGEGPSDLGGCPGTDTCEAPELQLGPMGVVVQKLVGDRPHSFRYLNKSQLKPPETADRKIMRFPRKKSPDTETRYYYDNARLLGDRAIQAGAKVAILFRDTDGTRATPGNRSDKVKSIRDGFSAAGFEKGGVPMLPNPKSEAWLLCGTQDYRDCAALENLPGNDAAPRSAKSRLDMALTDGHYESDTRGILAWMDSIDFEPSRLREMASFVEFSRDLDAALA